MSEEILAVLPTSKEKNYDCVQCVPKYSSEKTVLIPLYDEMQLECELVQIFLRSNLPRVLNVAILYILL